MPYIYDENGQEKPVTAQDVSPDIEENTGFVDNVKSYYQLDSALGSNIYNQMYHPEIYNAGTEDIVGPPPEDFKAKAINDGRFTNEQIGILSAMPTLEEYEIWQSKFADDNKALDIQARAGWTGLLGGVAAGIFDLDALSVLPFGKAFVAAKTGSRLADAGIAITGGAAAVGASEYANQKILQSSTQTLKSEDEVWDQTTFAAMTGAALLGAFKLPSTLKDTDFLKRTNKAVIDQFQAGFGSAGAMKAPVNAGTLKPVSKSKTVNKIIDTTLGTLSDDPIFSLMQSPSEKIRKATESIADIRYSLSETAGGRPVNYGGSLEGKARLRQKQDINIIEKTIRDKFLSYRNLNAKAFANSRAVIQDITGKNKGLLDISAFSQEVGKAMHRGDLSDIPEVKEAAEMLRPIIKTYGDDAVSLGILESVNKSPTNAKSYFPVIYRPETIARNPQVFKEVQIDALQREVEHIRSLQLQVEPLVQKRNDLQKSMNDFETTGDNADIASIKRQLDETNKNIIAILSRYDGEQTSLYKKKLEKKIKNLEEAQRNIKNKDDVQTAKKMLRVHEKALDNIIDDLMDKETDPTRLDFDSMATDITRNIISGHELYSDPRKFLNRKKNGSSADYTPQFLKQRVLNVHVDKLIENNFIDTDAIGILQTYTNKLAPYLEYMRFLQDQGDDFDLTDLKLDAKIFYDREFGNALDETELSNSSPEKKVVSIEKKQLRDTENLDVLRDRLLGIDRVSDNPNAIWGQRIPSFLLNYNISRLLGGIVLSSITDLAKIALTGNGVLKGIVKPIIQRIASPEFSKLYKENAEMLHDFGAAMDMVRVGEILHYRDVFKKEKRISRLEKVAKWSSARTMILSGFRSFNEHNRKAFAISLGSSIVKKAKRYTAKDAEELADIGIGKLEAKTIVNQFDKYGQKKGDLNFLNLNQWEDADLRSKLLLGMNKDLNRIFSQGDLNKSKFLNQSGWLKVIGQFKSFFIDSTMSFLYRGLQEKDMRFGIAIAEGIALGIFVEWIKLNQMGKEIPTDPAYWIIQGVERSGTLGILTELNSMTEKTANFGVRPSINAIFGTSLPENSRYTLNNPTDVLFGPSVGLVSGLAKFLNAASNENIDISKQDMYWLMRLIPGGNLPFTAPVTNKVINQF